MGSRNTVPMTVGSRIKTAREAKGMSRPELAERAGIKYPTLAGLENGDQQSSTQLPIIAEVLGVRAEWLRTGSGVREPRAIYGEPEWTDVRGYAQAAGLGDGAEADEYAETHRLKFRASSLSRKRLNPAHLGVMYGRGDSMLPRIRSGDAILFDQSDTRPQDEALFLIMVHGVSGDGYSVKRCRVIDDLVLFEALNPEGDHQWRKPRRMDDPRHPITIIGRVRWIGSWED